MEPTTNPEECHYHHYQQQEQQQSQKRRKKKSFDASPPVSSTWSIRFIFFVSLTSVVYVLHISESMLSPSSWSVSPSQQQLVLLPKKNGVNNHDGTDWNRFGLPPTEQQQQQQHQQPQQQRNEQQQEQQEWHQQNEALSMSTSVKTVFNGTSKQSAAIIETSGNGSNMTSVHTNNRKTAASTRDEDDSNNNTNSSIDNDSAKNHPLISTLAEGTGRPKNYFKRIAFSTRRSYAVNQTASADPSATAKIPNIRVTLSSASFHASNNNNVNVNTNRSDNNNIGKSLFFSACLVVMDENHRLPEWIAYHYYMLPLRHLVLLVDPRSESSPLEIVERWRPYFVQIDVWNFTDLEQYHTSPKHNKVDHIFYQQPIFYQQCFRHLRNLNRTWTTFHDVDEYIYLNPKFLAKDDYVPFISQPGSLQRFLTQETVQTRTLRQQKVKTHGLDAHCFLAPRNYYGAVESPLDIIQQAVPDYLNATHFETLRWLHSTSDIDHWNNGVGKSLVHVSSSSLTPQRDLTGAVHRILQSCRAMPRTSSVFMIRHYLGSWNVYTSRLDARVGTKRNREMFLFLTDASRGSHRVDDSIRPWLAGFCREFDYNVTVIQYLLKGTGQVPPKSNRIREAQWSMSPQQMQATIQKAQKGKNKALVRWFQQRFEITQTSSSSLSNTTIHVQSKAGHEPYPYSFKDNEG